MISTINYTKGARPEEFRGKKVMTKGPKRRALTDCNGIKRFVKTKISIENVGVHKPTIFVKYLSLVKNWIHTEIVYNQDAPYAKHLSKLAKIDENLHDYELRRLMIRAIIEYAGKAYNWTSQEKERTYNQMLESVLSDNKSLSLI